MVDSKHKWKAWLYLSPAIILLLVFTVWPIINTVRVSFLEGYDMLLSTNFDGTKVHYRVGFQNFINVARWPLFKIALGNTLLLCVITVPISTFLALLIAVALNSIKPLQRLLQTIFFLPYVTNSIAIGMVFATLFRVVGYDVSNPDSVNTAWGLINTFLGTRVDWIGPTSSRWANMFAVSVYIIWNALPFKILVLLGGLQGVNKQYYEAAKVDGTSRIRTFFRITVPLVSPMLAYVIITSFISGFKEYTAIVGLLGPNMGYGKQMSTMVGYIYLTLPDGKAGLAGAAALILFAIIFVVTMINLYVSNKKVHY